MRKRTKTALHVSKQHWLSLWSLENTVEIKSVMYFYKRLAGLRKA